LHNRILSGKVHEMSQKEPKTKRKPSMFMPFTLLAVLFIGIVAASIILKPKPAKPRKPRQHNLAREIDKLIIGLLRGEDWSYRNDLIILLRDATGMHFDYHPEHTEDLRFTALTRWEKWWNGVKSRYEGKELRRVDWLLDALNDESYKWRHVIIPEITKSKDPRAVDLLIKALEYEDENSSRLKIESAKALGEFGNSAATPALLKAAAGKDEKAAVEAARAIAMIKPSEYTKQIVGLSTQKSLKWSQRFELAMAALQILGKDKTPAEPAFLAYCRDAASDENAEFFLPFTVEALGTCGTRACLEVLEALMTHANPVVRKKAQRARNSVQKRMQEGTPK
jgi:hypothetical protein